MAYPPQAPTQAPAGAPARPAAPAAPGRPAGPPAPPQGQQNPQNKALGMHTKIVQAAMKILYQKEVVQQVLRMVAGAQDPAEGIAQAARFISQQVGQQAQAKGAPAQVANSALMPLAVLIIELAAAAGIVKDGPELRQQVQARLSGQTNQQPSGRMPAPPQAPQPQQAPPAPPAGLVEEQMEA